MSNLQEILTISYYQLMDIISPYRHLPKVCLIRLCIFICYLLHFVRYSFCPFLEKLSEKWYQFGKSYLLINHSDLVYNQDFPNDFIPIENTQNESFPIENTQVENTQVENTPTESIQTKSLKVYTREEIFQMEREISSLEEEIKKLSERTENDL